MMGDEGRKGDALRIMRVLLLPIPRGREAIAADTFLTAGLKMVESTDELDIKIRFELAEWLESGTPPPDLRRIVENVLASAWGRESPIPGRYFAVHHATMGGPDRLSFAAARLLLAQLPLIETLIRVEGASAAQVCRILAGHGSESQYSWNTIKSICVQFGWYRPLDPKSFKELFHLERTQEMAVFLDLSIEDCTVLLAAQARDYGTRADIAEFLLPILRPHGIPYYAVLEVLHYQLSLVEFFDHVPTYIYEFQPRGELANWMHAGYPDSIKTGKQAFLNIAKSVYRITEGWAFSKDRPEEALALSRLLSTVEDLGYAARREVSRSIRMLIHRTLKQHAGDARWIPAGRWDPKAVEGVIASITSSPSGTRGILEQRLTDVLGAAQHPSSEGWKATSIGTSVNATNRSALKFGDSEFHRIARGEIHAFEAHAGKLTEIYFEDHVATLRVVVPARRSQLEEIFDLKSTLCEVHFVAHEIAIDPVKLGEEIEIAGMRFRFHFSTFGDLGASCAIDAHFLDLWDRWFVQPLNNNGDTLTPQEVRGRVLDLLADTP